MNEVVHMHVRAVIGDARDKIFDYLHIFRLQELCEAGVQEASAPCEEKNESIRVEFAFVSPLIHAWIASQVHVTMSKSFEI